MSKKHLLMVQLEQSGLTDDLNKNKDFLLHMQDSLLLGLLGQEKITQRQYEWCMQELRRLSAP